jgi:hypothetical protein
MLAPADVQRYARQILVTQIGRPGQERWLASRVEAAGSGRALEIAAEFLEAAGVAVDRRDLDASPRLGDILLAETAFADRRAACDACLEAFFDAQPPASPGEDMAVAFAAGAGAAAEVLLGLLPDAKRSPIAMAFVPEPRHVAPAREGCSCLS